MAGIGVRNYRNAIGGVFYNGAVPYDSTGALLITGGLFQAGARPRYAMLGDSALARNNFYGTLDSAVLSGGTLTCTVAAGHVAWTGCRVKVWDGTHTAVYGRATASSSTVFTIPASYQPTGGINYMALDAFSDTGFINIGNCMAGQPWLYTGLNAACGGETTTQMMMRLPEVVSCDTTLFSYPDICVVHGGVNDIGLAGNVSAATESALVIANLQTIYQTLLQAGIQVVVSTILPINNGYAGYGPYQAVWPQTIQRVRDWQYDFCQKTQGVYLFDGWRAAVNYASATADWLSTTDGLHTNKASTQTVGAAFEKFLLSKYPPSQKRIGLNGSASSPGSIGSYGANTDNLELCDNPTLTGSGGTAAGTGVSGTIPAGITVTGAGGGAQTAVCSVVPAADGVGQDLVITFTSVGASDFFTVQATTAATTRVSAGDIVEFETRVSGSGIGGGNCLRYVEAQATITVSSVVGGASASNHGGGTDKYASDFDMTLTTPRMIIPSSGMTSLNPTVLIFHNAAGTCTYRINGWSFRKISS